MQCSVVLRVISTKEKIEELTEFHTFCLDTCALMSELFKWKKITGASHMLFGHVCFTIAMNGGFGLGHVFEGIYKIYINAIFSKLSFVRIKENYSCSHFEIAKTKIDFILNISTNF